MKVLVCGAITALLMTSLAEGASPSAIRLSQMARQAKAAEAARTGVKVAGQSSRNANRIRNVLQREQASNAGAEVAVDPAPVYVGAAVGSVALGLLVYSIISTVRSRSKRRASQGLQRDAAIGETTQAVK